MEFLQRSLDGLLEAGPYALIGLGLTLGFGVLRRLNLAYGAGALLAAYLGSWLHTRMGAPVWMVWLGVISLSVIVGLYVDALCFAESDQPANALQRVGGLVRFSKAQSVHVQPDDDAQTYDSQPHHPHRRTHTRVQPRPQIRCQQGACPIGQVQAPQHAKAQGQAQADEGVGACFQQPVE